jgi:hypothetical protein
MTFHEVEQAAPQERWCQLTPEQRNELGPHPVGQWWRLTPQNHELGGFVVDQFGVGHFVRSGNGSYRADEVSRPVRLPGKPFRLSPPPPEGAVVARCKITRAGNVQQCCMMRGPRGLTASLIAEIEQWRYEPMRFRGKPISVWYSIWIRIAR